jgi:hypothetical protein
LRKFLSLFCFVLFAIGCTDKSNNELYPRYYISIEAYSGLKKIENFFWRENNKDHFTEQGCLQDLNRSVKNKNWELLATVNASDSKSIGRATKVKIFCLRVDIPSNECMKANSRIAEEARKKGNNEVAFHAQVFGRMTCQNMEALVVGDIRVIDIN